MISATARADDLAVASNPYSSISERNIFALVPIPEKPTEPEAPPVDPPPKITVDGIMNLFGKLEVLFKIAVKPPPGQPAKDLSSSLSEGEREYEVEVVKIDEAKRMITFINHGVVQDVPLSDPAKLTGPASAPGGPGPIANANPAVNTGGGGIPMPTAAAGGQLIGRGSIRGRAGLSSPQTTGGGVGVAGGVQTAAAGANSDVKAESLSPETRVILMEAQRAKWLKTNPNAAAIIPPTPLTQAVLDDHAANPQ